MLDVRRIRQNPQELKDMLTRRNKDAGIVDDFLMKDEQRRKLMAEVEEKKALRNNTSKQIGAAKKNGASEAETAAALAAPMDIVETAIDSGLVDTIESREE